jgi:hypothetical protein
MLVFRGNKIATPALIEESGTPPCIPNIRSGVALCQDKYFHWYKYFTCKKTEAKGKECLNLDSPD